MRCYPHALSLSSGWQEVHLSCTISVLLAFKDSFLVQLKEEKQGETGWPMVIWKMAVKTEIMLVSASSRCAYKSSAVAEMGDRLATIDMGRKVWAVVPLSVGELSPHLTKCRLGRGLPVPTYQVASWSIQLFGHNTPTLQTDRQDNGPVAHGEPLLVTVAQKWRCCKLFVNLSFHV